MADPLNSQITSISEPGIKTGGTLLKAMRREVADLLGRNQIGFPGAQPVSFAKVHLEELQRQDYYVCEKSDGIRYLLYTTSDDDGSEAHYLIDRKNDYWFLHNRNLHFPHAEDRTAHLKDTITDGELVWDTLPDGRVEPRFLIFDCLVLAGDRLMDRTLDKRIAHIKTRLFDPYKKLFEEFPEERKFQPFFVEMKPFQLGYGVEMMFRQILPNLTHGNDGLIFTCRNTPYKPGTDPHILKWKPPEENTIDCRLRLFFENWVEPDDEDRAEGITEPWIDYDNVPRSEIFVYKGDSGPDRYERFADVHITEDEWETLKSLDDPLDNRIVECFRDEEGVWHIIRFRDDKHEANHTSTVMSVLESIKDRVCEQDLIAVAGKVRDNWKARASRDKAQQQPPPR